MSKYVSKQMKKSQELIADIQERPDIATYVSFLFPFLNVFALSCSNFTYVLWSYRYLATLSFRPRDKVLAFVAGLGFSLKFLVDITTVFTKGGWLLMDSEDWLFFGIEGATVLLAFFYADFLGAIFRSFGEKKEITGLDDELLNDENDTKSSK